VEVCITSAHLVAATWQAGASDRILPVHFRSRYNSMTDGYVCMQLPVYLTDLTSMTHNLLLHGRRSTDHADGVYRRYIHVLTHSPCILLLNPIILIPRE
jgi:hypothetical protein